MSAESLPKVQYRRLGKSGLRVSVPIIGGMSFGTSKWQSGPNTLDAEPALELLKYAWDRGVTTIDTANVYSNGESERIVGTFIKKYNIPREKLLILTKCFGLVHEEDISVRTAFYPELKDSRDYVNRSGLSRNAIFNAVENSLKRLDTPYIDLLQIHRFDPNVDPEEIMKALHDLVQTGKVRYIGASSMWTWQFAMLNNIAEKHNWTKFISMQSEYSLLYREEEREMNAYCNYNGIGLIPWGPVAAGVLCRPWGQTSARMEATQNSPFKRDYAEADITIINRVEELAKKKGWTMTQVALAWIGPKVSSPIVGCSSPKRLEEAIIAGKELTPEECEYLEKPYNPKRPKF